MYHLGVRPGEVANRVVRHFFVNSFSFLRQFPIFRRQWALNLGLNPLPLYWTRNPKVFKLASERGFFIVTGRYKRIPVSVVSIGMGSPNMDFFVREIRESVNGDMVVIRFGSIIPSYIFSESHKARVLRRTHRYPSLICCGPRALLQISRNVDFDFAHPEDNSLSGSAYRISKPVSNPLKVVSNSLYLMNGQVSGDAELSE